MTDAATTLATTLRRQTGLRLPPARVIRSLLLPLTIVVVWEAIGCLQLVDPTLLPTPLAVLKELVRSTVSGELAANLAVSARRVLLGFAIGTAVATLLGAITGYSLYWRGVIDPTVHALRTIPGLAWIPMFILWLGIDEGSKLALIALATFFPTYLNFMSGISRVDRKLIEVGRVNGLVGARLVWTVLLPFSLPFLFVGLRQSMGVAWLVVVGAELMGASSGIGYMLNDGEMTGRPALIMACMIVFAACGKTTDVIIATIARRILSWQDTAEES
jgi:sulfonate transport system permease protein